MTELITLIGAGAITLAGTLFGNNGPSVKVQRIESYGQCLSATKDEALCSKILDVYKKKEKPVEDEACHL